MSTETDNKRPATNVAMLTSIGPAIRSSVRAGLSGPTSALSGCGRRSGPTRALWPAAIEANSYSRSSTARVMRGYFTETLPKQRPFPEDLHGQASPLDRGGARGVEECVSSYLSVGAFWSRHFTHVKGKKPEFAERGTHGVRARIQERRGVRPPVP